MVMVFGMVEILWFGLRTMERQRQTRIQTATFLKTEQWESKITQYGLAFTQNKKQYIFEKPKTTTKESFSKFQTAYVK